MATQRHATRRVDREVERVRTALKAYAKGEVAVGVIERARDDKTASLVQQVKRTFSAPQLTAMGSPLQQVDKPNGAMGTDGR
jgi:hypothetical protein